MRGAPTRSSPSVKRFRDLARANAARTLEREILLDGIHLLTEALDSNVTIAVAAFERSLLDNPSVARLADRLTAAGADVMIVPRNTLEAMSPVKTPSGAVAIGRRAMTSIRDALAARAPALALIAVDVQDPGNVGALARTAEAAGATAFVACGATADPLGWKALRGSMGSALRVPIARGRTDEALTACREAGIPTSALDIAGDAPFFSADFRPPTALIVGSEGAGLPPDILSRADRRLAIPMHPPVESLNVGVAAALVLYEAFRQRRTAADRR